MLLIIDDAFNAVFEVTILLHLCYPSKGAIHFT